jgi:hypothetical protein
MANWVINYLEFEGTESVIKELLEVEENQGFSKWCFDVAGKGNKMEFVSHWRPNLFLVMEISHKFEKSIVYGYFDTANYCSGEYQIVNGKIISQKHWDAAEEEVDSNYVLEEYTFSDNQDQNSNDL